MITQQLAVITVADTTPLLPSSLNTTNNVLTAVINALEQVGNDTVTTVTETNEVNNCIFIYSCCTYCFVHTAYCGCLQ